MNRALADRLEEALLPAFTDPERAAAVLAAPDIVEIRLALFKTMYKAALHDSQLRPDGNTTNEQVRMLVASYAAEQGVAEHLIDWLVEGPVAGFYRPTPGDMPGTWNVFSRDGRNDKLNVPFDDLPNEVKQYLMEERRG
jgi:hypothetical protein